jgi:hypothetical protein
MNEHKSPQHRTPYPDVLRNLLDTPQLLQDENLKDFFRLFDSLEGYLKPKTDWDYLVTCQATMLTWDTHRAPDRVSAEASGPVFERGGEDFQSNCRGGTRGDSQGN